VTRVLWKNHPAGEFHDSSRGSLISATECLEKDKGVVLAFYEFPAEHRVPIRTTNSLVSVFFDGAAASRQDQGSGSRVACLTMVFKLMETASRGWRSLNGSPLLVGGDKGTVFKDGIKEKPAT
jgi:putative transposase